MIILLRKASVLRETNDAMDRKPAELACDDVELIRTWVAPLKVTKCLASASNMTRQKNTAPAGGS